MSASEVKDIVRQCLALDTRPYDEAPAAVLPLAKGKA